MDEDKGEDDADVEWDESSSYLLPVQYFFLSTNIAPINFLLFLALLMVCSMSMEMKSVLAKSMIL